jgi:hypothetical protein
MCGTAAVVSVLAGCVTVRVTRPARFDALHVANAESDDAQRRVVDAKQRRIELVCLLFGY